MKIITRYIIRQIWIPALLAAVVISFLAVAAGVQEQVTALMDRAPIAQITLADISKISLFILPTLVALIVPITYLLGIMLTFGRMAQRNELTSLKAAGVPLRKAVVPVVIVGAFLSGFTFLVQDQAQPYAHRKLSDLVTSDLPLRVTLDMLPTGIMHSYGGWRIYLGGKDADGTLRDIVVLQPHEDGKADAFYADSAQVEKGARGHFIVLKNGYLIPADEARKTSFETLRHKIPALAGRDPLTSRLGMPLAQLLREERQTAKDYEETQAIPVLVELRKLRIEIGERLSFPLMCLAVSIVAAPLGARTPPRSGRTYTFAAGFLIVAGYFILRKVAEPVWVPSLPGAIAMAQIPNILLTTIGLGFLIRVDRV
jgi:lipopolysaccharide export system permease protein